MLTGSGGTIFNGKSQLTLPFTICIPGSPGCDPSAPGTVTVPADSDIRGHWHVTITDMSDPSSLGSCFGGSAFGGLFFGSPPYGATSNTATLLAYAELTKADELSFVSTVTSVQADFTFGEVYVFRYRHVGKTDNAYTIQAHFPEPTYLFGGLTDTMKVAFSDGEAAVEGMWGRTYDGGRLFCSGRYGGTLRKTFPVEVLHGRLTLREGETMEFTLLRAHEDLRRPTTITLAPDRDGILSFDPEKIVLTPDSREGRVRITAIDNHDAAPIEPVFITLSAEDDNVYVYLPPGRSGQIRVSIFDDDLYSQHLANPIIDPIAAYFGEYDLLRGFTHEAYRTSDSCSALGSGTCSDVLFMRLTSPRVTASAVGSSYSFDIEIRAANPPGATTVGAIADPGGAFDPPDRSRLGNIIGIPLAYFTYNTGAAGILEFREECTAQKGELLSAGFAPPIINSNTTGDRLDVGAVAWLNNQSDTGPTAPGLQQIPHDRFARLMTVSCNLGSAALPPGTLAQTSFHALSHDTLNQLTGPNTIEPYAATAANDLINYPLSGRGLYMADAKFAGDNQSVYVYIASADGTALPVALDADEFVLRSSGTAAYGFSEAVSLGADDLGRAVFLLTLEDRAAVAESAEANLDSGLADAAHYAYLLEETGSLLSRFQTRTLYPHHPDKPYIAGIALSEDNTTLTVRFSDDVFTNRDGTGGLEFGDFDIRLYGSQGQMGASIASAAPTKVTDREYRFGIAGVDSDRVLPSDFVEVRLAERAEDLGFKSLKTVYISPDNPSASAGRLGVYALQGRIARLNLSAAAAASPTRSVARFDPSPVRETPGAEVAVDVYAGRNKIEASTLTYHDIEVRCSDDRITVSPASMTAVIGAGEYEKRIGTVTLRAGSGRSDGNNENACTVSARIGDAAEAAVLEGALILLDDVMPYEARIEVFTDRTIIPEGSTASVLIRASFSEGGSPVTVNLAASGPGADRTALSSGAAQLRSDKPSTLITVSVSDDAGAQTGNAPFSVALSSEPPGVFRPPALNFIIPPNDLTAAVNVPAGFEAGDTSQTVTVAVKEGLRDRKSFAVSSLDSRVIVRDGIITSGQDSFDVVLYLKEGTKLDREEAVALAVSHLDALQPSARNSAQISAGASHACAVRVDNAVSCWGSNANGQADLTNSFHSGNSSVDVSGDKFLSVDAGASHVCAVLIDNTIACWGYDGSPSDGRTTGIIPSDHFLSVSAGASHTCAVRTDGTLLCRGANTFFGLLTNQATPPEGDNFLSVSAGAGHTCAVRTDGALRCWGLDSSGSVSGPNADPGAFLSVSSGRSHTCAVRTDGALRCWGLNSSGSVSGPNADPGAFLSVSAGAAHTCAVRADNTIACWGSDSGGQASPIGHHPADQGGPIAAGDQFLAVSAGASHACAVRINGTLACWGNNADSKAAPPAGLQARVSPDTSWLLEKSQLIEDAVKLQKDSSAQTDDDVQPGFIGFAGSMLTLEEGATGTVTVVGHSLPSETAVSVTVAEESGEQIILHSPSDSGTELRIVLPPGSSSLTITVEAPEDDDPEREKVHTIRMMMTESGPAGPSDETKQPAPFTKFRDCPECPEMTVVPAGSFSMGSTVNSNEQPVHTVTISEPFAVGIHEVTFYEYDACVNAGGCPMPGPIDPGWGRGTRPVLHVSWNDASSYTAWLSQKTKQQYRLLTEAEWEYAARAGTTTTYSFGDTISTGQAHYNRRQTVPVGSYEPNAFGLHDVHGNVREWTEDCWHSSYGGAPSDGRAWLEDGGGDCDLRVMRGGSWCDGPQDLRSAYRGRGRADIVYTCGGFRVARTL